MTERPALVIVLLDAGLLAGLVLALVLVMAVDGGGPPATPADASVVLIPEPEPPPPPVRHLRLGVTPDIPQFDDMAKLLDALGEGFPYDKFDLDDLIEPERVGKYDVIFLTCSGMGPTWLATQVGTSSRGLTTYTRNLATFAKAKECLRAFVRRGGTLYASDLHFGLVEECFPEFVDESRVDSGRMQVVHAEVVDPGLRELIGSGLDLRFDQAGWKPAAFKRGRVTVLLQGEYESDSGEQRTCPLLVKFTLGDGAVIFTSFHNEQQNSDAEIKLLKYLVFSAITAGAETQAANKMMQGGFAPTKRNLFSASGQQESVTRKYECTQAGDLKFVLAFADQGARLRLTVQPPSGSPLVREGTATITIDVAGAAPGVYEYTVTALRLPNANFPFTVTVGRK